MKKKKLLMGLVALSAITGVSTLAACTEVPADVEVQSFTVTFQTNGGSAVESVTVTADGTLPTIATPTRDGYTFDGWYTDANLTSAVTLSSLKVTANITLYAKWTAVATVETYTVSFDTQVEGLTVAAVTTDSNGKITVANPTRDGYFFGGWYTDADCTGTAVDLTTQTFTADTTLYAKWTVEAATSYTLTYMLDENTVYETKTINQIVTEDGTILFPAQGPSAAPSRKYYTFDGWYTDQTYTTPFSLDTSLNGNTLVYAKWGATYESVTTEVKVENVAKGTDVTFKRFNFEEIESVTDSKSNTNIYNGDIFSGEGYPTTEAINTFSSNLIKVAGDVNVTFASAGTFNIIVANASGSSDSFTFTNNDDFSVTKNMVSGTLTGYSNYYQSYTIEVPKAGEYKLDFEGKARILSMTIVEQLQAGPISSISANTTNNDNVILIGRDYSLDGLMINVQFENGRVDTVYASDCDITGDDLVDSTTAGTYTVNIKYVKDEIEKTCSYTVEVIEPTSLAVFTHVQKDPTEMNSLLQVYTVGDVFSNDNLNVVLYGKTADGQDVSFLAESDEYTLSEISTTTAGVKELSITTATNTAIPAAKLNIVVLPTQAAESVITSVTVDKNLSAEYTLVEGALSFKTITSAYQYLATLGNDVQKTLYIKNGIYEEKLYINIPNLTVKGESKAGVIIQSGYYSGMTDAEGHSYLTRGSATVFVTSKAVNFALSDVTILNTLDTSNEYWDTRTLTNNTQAVALYTAAVNGTYKNCNILGYHDTLEIDYNDNYFEECYISGRTDYIFGYSAQAYFYKCTINTVVGYTGKDSTTVDTNGGYIVATNPITATTNSNYNADYAFVFNDCEFTADEGVIAGSVALARVWGASSRVIVANSTIGAHVSTDAFTGTESNGARYCTMSGNVPGNGSSFIEYNNDGAGAISASQSYGDPAKTVVTYKSEADAEINSFLNLSEFYEDWTFDNKLQAGYKLSFESAYSGQLTTETAINAHLAELTMLQWTNIFDISGLVTEGFVIEGLSIEGVYTDASCAAEYKIEDLTQYTITAGTSGLESKGLYVKYQDNGVKVTFNAGDGGVVTVGDSDKQTVTENYTKNDGGITLASAQKVGYKFEYWTLTAPESWDGAPTEYTVPQTGISEDITLYAYYSQISGIKYSLADSTNDNTGWTVVGNGTRLIGITAGLDNNSVPSGSDQYVLTPKVFCTDDASQHVTSPTIPATNSVTVKALTGTKGTGNSLVVTIEGLDENGNVVATTTANGPKSKLSGYLVKGDSTNIVITSQNSDIVKVRLWLDKSENGSNSSKELGFVIVELSY